VNFKKLDIAKIVPILGLVLALCAVLTSAKELEQLIITFLLPLAFCLAMLIKRWWICGIAYIAVFIYSRSSAFYGRYTLASCLFDIAIVVIFVIATYKIYKFRKKEVKNEVKF
jgi:hypothetical protein